MSADFPTLYGSGVLINWMDVPPDVEVDFNEWYSFQHLPERVGIPGFNRGRRYVVVGDDLPGKWFTVYETDDLDVLQGEAYLERLNTPTEWTSRMVESLLYLSRTACELAVSVGQGTAANILTVEFGPSEGNAEQLRDWIAGVLPALLDERKIVSGHLFQSDSEVTSAKDQTAEGATAVPPGELARWLLMIELGFETAEAVRERLVGADGIDAHGGSGDNTVRNFREITRLTSR